MHSVLLLITALGAIALRLRLLPTAESPWIHRWQRALAAFALPPLLLLVMAIAVLVMGRHGSMLGWHVGWLGYGMALLLGLGSWLQLVNQLRLTYGSWGRLRSLPLVTVAGESARQLPCETPFAARVGFWQPELVLSAGLEAVLTPAQLQAVLHHEQAHLHYRDTFWFFWLGWLRRATLWLPETESLWQELLLLRELRADRWAAQSSDPIALGESLLLLAQGGKVAEPGWALFADDLLERGAKSRLEQRLDALLSPEAQLGPGEEETVRWQASIWLAASLALSALPLLTNLWHRAA